MNRLQLSPISHGTKSHPPLGFRERRSGPLASWDDVKLLRSWLVYDSDLEASRTRGRLNWSAIAGLLATVAVSAGGWYCVALVVRHFLK